MSAADPAVGPWTCVASGDDECGACAQALRSKAQGGRLAGPPFALRSPCPAQYRAQLHMPPIAGQSYGGFKTSFTALPSTTYFFIVAPYSSSSPVAADLAFSMSVSVQLTAWSNVTTVQSLPFTSSQISVRAKRRCSGRQRARRLQPTASLLPLGTGAHCPGNELLLTSSHPPPPFLHRPTCQLSCPTTATTCPATTGPQLSSGELRGLAPGAAAWARW